MPRRRLVIDSSVLASSGSISQERPPREDYDPSSKLCREFLMAVLRICHCVAATPELLSEWYLHRSGFSRKWLVQMFGKKKVRYVHLRPGLVPVQKIERTSGKAEERQAMKKDVLLIEAALATDRIVVSRDETARRLFSRASKEVRELKSIVWVNPEQTEKEQLIRWLEAGAKLEQKRRLGFRGTPR